MGRPQSDFRRKSSTVHYQTFPTPPPKSKGQPPSDASSHDDLCNSRTPSRDSEPCSPLPVKQLCVLAFISLCEQTALNSIGPYLPQMSSSFPFAKEGSVGLYVGSIASSFALAQFATNFFWGWLSDHIGRKPVVLTGTFLTSMCFVAFGFVRTFPQAIAVQAAMGLVNGNQGVVSTCLGEITDRSNQSKAFIYLPVIYGLGGITGPVLGGLLVNKDAMFSEEKPYPYFLPNIIAAALLIVDLIVSMIFLEESLEEAKNLPPLGKRVMNLFSWAWQLASSHRPTYTRMSDGHYKFHQARNGTAEYDEDGSESESDAEENMPMLLPTQDVDLSSRDIVNRDTILLLASYLIFQFSNIAYGALYPIFGQARPPRGRGLSPQEIGFSLAFAGAATIVFQLGVFGKIREKVGNKVTYRSCIAGIALSFLLTPWIGYKEPNKGSYVLSTGKGWLWFELGFVLLIKSLSAVGCLTSFLLLVSSVSPRSWGIWLIHSSSRTPLPLTLS